MLHSMQAGQTPDVATMSPLEVNGHQLVRETPKPRFYFVTPRGMSGRTEPTLRCQVCGVVYAGTSVFEQYGCRGPA